MSSKSCLRCQQAIPVDSVSEICPTCEAAIDETLVQHNGPASNVPSDSVGMVIGKGKDLRASDSGHSKLDTSVDDDAVEAMTLSLRGFDAGVKDGGALSKPTGARRFGDYEILDELARGGMGVVFKARQVSLNRLVALKMILSARLASEADVKRFYLEAQLAAKLEHPGIVPIHEVGEHEGQHFFSMALVEGGSLDNLTADGPIPPRTSAELLRTLAEAVHYAHARNIVHRDLKPANVLLDEKGQPKIADFGLAKNSDGDSVLTAAGQVMGTPAYMAPEQAAGRIEEVGSLADVYALGGILYFLLTGEPPFRGKNAIDTIRQVQHSQARSPRHCNPRVDLDLATICLKCLEKEPRRRYASAAELAADLDLYVAGRPIVARPVGALERCWRWCKRNPLVTVTTIVLLGFLVGSSCVVYELQQRARAESLVDRLVEAEVAQVPAIASELTLLHRWTYPLLKASIPKAKDDSKARLHLSLGLLPVDPSQIDYLSDQLPVCTLNQLPILRESLAPHREDLTDALWELLQDEEQDAARRFNAAAALAEFAPNDLRWRRAAPFVAEHLTSAIPSVYVDDWVQLFEPARDPLTAPLTGIQADPNRSQQQGEAAAFALAEYLSDQPDKLADNILAADRFAEFSLLLPALRPHSPVVARQLVARMQAAMPGNPSVEQRDALWKQQAMAAVTLVHLGHGEAVWSLLKFMPDPSLRSLIIHYLAKLRVDYNALAARMGVESDVSIRRALIQSLGALDSAQISRTDRNRITEQLKASYANDPDPGVHGSASWALRQWAVILPELPIGEPVLTEMQKQRIAKQTVKVAETRQRLADYKQSEIPTRQATWERMLLEEFAPAPALDEGLVAHYPLDETEGTVISSAVEGPPDGSYVGPGSVQSAPGVIGGALRLNGQMGHLSLGQAFNPERTDSFSYGGWFLSDSPEQLAALLAKMNVESDYRGIDLFFDKGRICVHVKHEWPNNSLKVVSVASISSGAWRHVFMTYDGSSSAAGITIYIDGQATPVTVEADSLTKTIQNGVPLCIGKRSEGDTFEGWIDDVRIYMRRLASWEVQQLYESGVRDLAAISADQRSTTQQAVMTDSYQSRDETLVRLVNQLTAQESTLWETRWDGVQRWSVNSQGQSMVVFSNRSRHADSQIDHSFEISSREVSVAEFRKFRTNFYIDRNVAPTGDCPVCGLNWYTAAQYCNWLSEQEGISEDQWVYATNDRNEYADGMKIREDYLESRGYRLPTAEEWEQACRAGTTGTYCFGEPLSLLSQYSQYIMNSAGRSQSVASLLPNSAGLFDMHGNILEWTQTPVAGPPSPIRNGRRSILCGGSFSDVAEAVRSVHQHINSADSPAFSHGFRVARTYLVLPN